MEIQIVGVVGAGIMGTGLSQSLAQVGLSVVLIDVSHETLEEARTNISNNVRFQKLIGKDVQQFTAIEILQKINFSTDYSNLAQADFIIENVTEKWSTKKTVFEKVDVLCKIDCVFASNTSAIPITKIGAATRRPEKVIGMHFMNPVHLKNTVEIIRGYHTSEPTVKSALELLSVMGKDYILVNDAPGFVTNRVLMVTINEAIYLVQENTANPRDIDKIFKSCVGHKMGPLETADLIGLDTILYSLEVLYESFNDSKYRPCPLLKKMVDAGLFGRKNGMGFYKYS